MHVCMYIYISVCVCVIICIHIYICIYIYVCIYLCIYIYGCAWVIFLYIYHPNVITIVLFVCCLWGLDQPLVDKNHSPTGPSDAARVRLVTRNVAALVRRKKTRHDTAWESLTTLFDNSSKLKSKGSIC